MEKERVKHLISYNILYTPQENNFDAITQLASQICHAPISLITLVDEDKQWFKSNYGTSVQQTSRDISFCTHTIETDDGWMIVEDTTKDKRFKQNPLVTGHPYVKFYAGVSLCTKEGFRLGTLCVLDHKPRTLSQDQLNALTTLSQYAMTLIELQKRNKELEQLKDHLSIINSNLESFSYAVAHDIKAPFRIMNSYIQLLMRSAKPKLVNEEIEYLEFIQQNAVELSKYVKNLLHFTKATHVNIKKADQIPLNTFLQQILHLLQPDDTVNIQIPPNLPIIQSSEVALKQIFLNLISNAIKYRNVDESLIQIDFKEDNLFYYFTVKDNGIGISSDRLKSLFELFKKDEYQEESSGIGLHITRKLIRKMGGNIVIISNKGEGTTIDFKILKYLHSEEEA